MHGPDGFRGRTDRNDSRPRNSVFCQKARLETRNDFKTIPIFDFIHLGCQDLRFFIINETFDINVMVKCRSDS